ncbi:hypothetical protein Pcinc_003121 [Petrolisthes cinctipes]|uniref:Uncharacterized protein n=1 Tax=Petrolisthes cinctipes TaxID=88211 RepID=A0AAE1GP51_PETCI|nr:hypothetical protein Pcinc_003121 [Petrolisthes cinctipes]
MGGDERQCPADLVYLLALGRAASNAGNAAEERNESSQQIEVSYLHCTVEYYTQPSNSWKNRGVHLSEIVIVWRHYPLLDAFPTQSGNHQYRA